MVVSLEKDSIKNSHGIFNLASNRESFKISSMEKLLFLVTNKIHDFIDEESSSVKEEVPHLAIVEHKQSKHVQIVYNTNKE